MIAFVGLSYYVQRSLAHGGLCLRVKPVRSYSLLVEKKLAAQHFVITLVVMEMDAYKALVLLVCCLIEHIVCRWYGWLGWYNEILRHFSSYTGAINKTDICNI